MKSRKNRIKRGGSAAEIVNLFINPEDRVTLRSAFGKSIKLEGSAILVDGAPITIEKYSGLDPEQYFMSLNEAVLDIEGGSKHKSTKSRKAKKTKKGRGSHEGGKKKCPKHCRLKTRRSRKRLKHRKN